MDPLDLVVALDLVVGARGSLSIERAPVKKQNVGGGESHGILGVILTGFRRVNEVRWW